MPMRSILVIGLMVLSGEPSIPPSSERPPVLELRGFVRRHQFLQPGYIRIETVDRCGNAVDGYVTELPILSDRQFRFAEATVAVTKGGSSQERSRIVVPVTEDGGKALRAWTGQNVGRGLAVLLHGSVVWVPTINDRFAGPIILEGCYTRAEAERILSELKASPNKSLQRTQSASPPSPLSSKLLGATRQASLAAVQAALAISCASAGHGVDSVLEGVAVSPDGRPQPSVVVTVTTEKGSLLLNRVTPPEGTYRFPALSAGTYWVSCSKASRSMPARPISLEKGETRFVACVVQTGEASCGGIVRHNME
jgi:hypothetical protein